MMDITWKYVKQLKKNDVIEEFDTSTKTKNQVLSGLLHVFQEFTLQLL